MKNKNNFSGKDTKNKLLTITNLFNVERGAWELGRKSFVFVSAVSLWLEFFEIVNLCLFLIN